MQGNLEQVASWKLRIKKDALDGLMVGISNTARAFNSDGATVNVDKTNEEADAKRIDGTIDLMISVKTAPGAAYPVNLVGMLAHDVYNRFGSLVYQEYRRE